MDEAQPSLEPGTFINGFHETWPSSAPRRPGLARTGQTICNIPDAMVFELFVDHEPLFVPTARLREYARVHDMRNGVLERDLVWSTAGGST